MEYGSHISVSTQAQPSLLEVTAQDSLTATLQPAFSHLLKVVGDKVQGLRWLSQCSAELFTALHALLQWHCITTHKSSFSEHFYGLQRVDLKSLGTSYTSAASKAKLVAAIRRLVFPGASSNTRSLVILVLLPYLQHKLATKYEKDLDSPLPVNGLSRLKQRLVFLWPYINLLLGITKAAYYIRYLTGASGVCSLQHQLCGVTLLRCSEEEGESNSSTLVELLMEALEVSAFFLQFLDWYYSSDRSTHSTSSSTSQAAVPPAPHQVMEKMYGSRADLKTCPICKQERAQPTAISVSGVVYCYSCIMLHLKQRQTCPVSGLPATFRNLVRLHE